MQGRESYMSAALIIAVVGLGALYLQVPPVEKTEISSVSLEQEGRVLELQGTALDVRDVEGGTSFRLVGNGSVNVVAWREVEIGEGDLVSVVGRIAEYRDEAEVVAEEINVTRVFAERPPKRLRSAEAGDAVIVEGTVSRSMERGALTEGDVYLKSVDAGPGDVLEVRGIVEDPGLPEVLAIYYERTGTDEKYLFEGVGSTKEAVYAGRRGRVVLNGTIGGARYSWLHYLYDDSKDGLRDRHVSDVLVNEIPLRFPRDYIGHVPSTGDRVKVEGRLESYRGNPQVSVDEVEVLGTTELPRVDGEVEDVEGRSVLLNGGEYVLSPGADVENGENASFYSIDAWLHTGEKVSVLIPVD